MTTKHTLLLVFSLLFIAAALPMLLWGFWPPSREVRLVPLSSTAGRPSLPDGHTLRLEFSPDMRHGDSQIIELKLSAGNSPQAAIFYEQTSVFVESRLELAFTDVRPADVILTRLGQGETVTFYWEVNPREAGKLRGTLWLYLRLVPRTGGEESRQPVSAQLLEIRSSKFLGLTGRQARGTGLLALLVGLLPGIPWLRRRLR